MSSSTPLFPKKLRSVNVLPTNIQIGGIILWSGSTGSIPINWALCDGTNGTPITNQFVIGAGSTYSFGDTGGSTSVTLSTGNLPSHTHPIGINYISTSVSGGGDTRVTDVGGALSSVDSGATGTSGATGSGTPFYILPPYYALCYIM